MDISQGGRRQRRPNSLRSKRYQRIISVTNFAFKEGGHVEKSNTFTHMKTGDLFQFRMKKKYGLCQIVHIGISTLLQKGSPLYTAVIFNQLLDDKPHIDDIKHLKLYQVQWKPKNLLLYFQVAGRTPTAKYVKIGNFPVNAQLELPTEDTNLGIRYPMLVANWQWALQRISDDLQHQKPDTKIASKYFSQWVNAVDTETLQRSEKIIDQLVASMTQSSTEAQKTAKLQTAIRKFNQLEEARSFLYTIEAEELYECLLTVATQCGIATHVAAEVIDRSKQW